MDKFVRQKEKITDYRTKYSGIRPRDVADDNAELFEDVQLEAAASFKDRIIVGHAIHNDLKVSLTPCLHDFAYTQFSLDLTSRRERRSNQVFERLCLYIGVIAIKAWQVQLSSKPTMFVSPKLIQVLDQIDKKILCLAITTARRQWRFALPLPITSEENTARNRYNNNLSPGRLIDMIQCLKHS